MKLAKDLSEKEIVENEINKNKTSASSDGAASVGSDNTSGASASAQGADKEKAAMSEKKAKALEEIEKLQEEFRNKTYADVKKMDLQKIEYVEPDDDELTEKAKKSVEERFNTKRRQATESAENKSKTLSEALSEIAELSEKQKAEADKYYEDAKKASENSAIKRGVARSSMAQNAVTELAKALADKKSDIDIAAAEKSGKLNDELRSVGAEFEKLLNSITEEEIVAATDAYDKLKKEANDEKNEVVKYNNSLEEKQKEFEAKTLGVKNEEEIARIKNDYDMKKFSVALDYYLSLSDPKDALSEFVKDEEMKDYLGGFYDYLLAVLKNRAK